MAINVDFKLEQFNRNVDERLLLEDLQRVDKLLSPFGKKISCRIYNKLGKFSSATVSTRFGKWNIGLAKAGINTTQEKNVDEKKLFNNLKEVWINKGRQPVFRDMCKKPSKYTAQPYCDRYGGWRKALEAFIKYFGNNNINIGDSKEIEFNTDKISMKNTKQRRTNRNISERMRFSILLRDGFRCQSCGRSPVKSPGIELHVDHIIPWSKGGETVPENLQTKCKNCNLGKGNAFDK